MMFRIHHGLQDFTEVTDSQHAAATVALMLDLGLTNILVTRKGVDVTGCNDWEDKRDDGRIGTIVLEIPVQQ